MHPEFVASRNPTVGVLHFDFNSFKRLNELVGYHNADRIIEDFGRNCCEEFDALAKPWTNPISTGARAWCALQQYAQRPEFAWYLGRIGGDKFGVVYVSTSSAISRVKDALEKALAKTEQTSVHYLHHRGEWEPLHRISCPGFVWSWFGLRRAGGCALERYRSKLARGQERILAFGEREIPFLFQRGEVRRDRPG